MAQDDEILKYLKALSGDEKVWDGFDPSALRSDQAKGAESQKATGSTGAMPSSQGDDSRPAPEGAAELELGAIEGPEGAEDRGHKLNKARQHAAQEAVFSPEAEELEKVNWEQTGLSKGDVSPEGQTFMPWRLVAGYPFTYVGKANSARIAPLFTLEALHKNRVWDLYYIHPPAEMNLQAVVLVPTCQFQHLLDAINAKLGIQLTIPPGQTQGKFMMSFGLGNTPRPRFLGRSDSAATFESLCSDMPDRHPDDDLSRATQLGLEEFRHLLSRTRAHRRSRQKSDRNRAKRADARREFGRAIKRVQRYLGLRAKAAVEVATKLAELDVNTCIASEPEGSVLFAAIDIEAWEHNQDMVTEVGIAVLDTADIRDVPPGDGGQNWFPKIRARHIRVAENSWAANKDYVRGCADRFDFGTSEFIEIASVKRIIEDTINRATVAGPAGPSGSGAGADGGKPRAVVLVFHEAASDVKFLKTLGYQVAEAANVVEVVDTRAMHQYMIRSNDSASLATVLRYLGIAHRNLHNAGNDAVYTLQAMVGLAVKKRVMGRQREGGDEVAVCHAHLRPGSTRKEEGWTSNEDSDGGDPVGLTGCDTGSELPTDEVASSQGD